MRQIITLLLCTVVVFTVAAQKEVKTISFAGNKLFINLPAGMDTMPVEKIMIKYQKKPDEKTAYYGNADYSFSLVVTEIANDITEAMLEPLKPQLLAQLGKQEFTENRMLVINGHTIMAAAYTSVVPGNKIFNRHFFVVAGGRLFTLAFNSTETDLAARKAQIEKSIRSLKIK